MLYALCSLPFKVDITPPVVYSVHQREAEENQGILGALFIGMDLELLNG